MLSLDGLQSFFTGAVQVQRSNAVFMEQRAVNRRVELSLAEQLQGAHHLESALLVLLHLAAFVNRSEWFAFYLACTFNNSVRFF